MKLPSKGLALLISILLLGTAQGQDFMPDQSCLAYRAEKTMFLFKDIIVWGTSCEVNASLEKVASGWVARVSVPFATIKTDDEDRDADLKENYFFVDKYPNLSFQSQVITKSMLLQAKKGGEWFLLGNLTVMDQVKRVKFSLTLTPKKLTGKMADGMSRLGVTPPKIAGGFFVEVHEPVEIHLDLLLSEIEGAAQALASVR